MRQVPYHYLIIGAGRMARHFAHYFNLLDIPFQQWSRQDNPKQEKLTSFIKNSTHILLLISDAAIENFIKDNPVLQNKIIIHFSGCLITPLAQSTHPLMTFGNELYSLEVYQNTPFILEQEGSPFIELLPGLNNPHHFIPQHLKPLYHTLCVMSANFTVILWQKFIAELHHKFQLPTEVIYPYLEQTFHNLRHDSKHALTGPLVRNDTATITNNLKALENDPFQKIYQAFTEAYQHTKETT